MYVLGGLRMAVRRAAVSAMKPTTGTGMGTATMAAAATATAARRMVSSMSTRTTTTTTTTTTTAPAAAQQKLGSAMGEGRRGMAIRNIGGMDEEIVERSEYPMEKVREILGGETMAMIGYGSQGRGQALNMRDNGLKVIIGLRKTGQSWELALKDGWVEGETLFSVEDAAQRGTVVMYLLSDAGQKEMWPTLKPFLTKGKTLFFSHGFSVVYKDQTNVVPPADIDVILVAPKGSGTTVRRHFLDGSGINSSYAVFQDVSGRAQDKVKAIGIGLGSGYMFSTTFEKEVYSDLTGERGTLMGGIYGLWMAQYEVLRAAGHSPSEAYNETVEEATESLYPLIAENGMDWMYANCSTTAQRGALDWCHKFRDANLPVMKALYDSVKTGKETARTLDVMGRADYRERLAGELKEIRESEMWRAGADVRKLRPRNAEWKKKF